MGMMTTEIELSMICGACGHGRVTAPCDARDDAPVRCPSCHTELGVWAEVKEQARAAMFDALRGDFSAFTPSALDTPARENEACTWSQAA